MANVQIRNEVMFKAPTRVGLLADVTDALNAAGVNILAIGAYDKGDMGEFLMITSNNKLAYEALADWAARWICSRSSWPRSPTSPANSPRSRGCSPTGINVRQVFATSIDGADKVMIVLTASARRTSSACSRACRPPPGALPEMRAYKLVFAIATKAD